MTQAPPLFSIVIPAHNEEQFIEKCLQSIHEAGKAFPDQFEIIVALNRCSDATEAIARQYGARITTQNEKNIGKTRNAAAAIARGTYLITIDADSWMAENMLLEVDRYLRQGFIGGGVNTKPERYSLGIFCTFLMILPFMLLNPVSAGMFWCLRSDYEALGGFDERLHSGEDLDFAKRLKALGRKKKQKFKTITKAYITTSCRKFDQFGDWYIAKNPRMALRIIKGNSQKDANLFYYDVGR